MKLSKEDEVTLIGILAFIFVGLISYFLFKIEWYPTLGLSALVSIVVGLVSYKLLR